MKQKCEDLPFREKRCEDLLNGDCWELVLNRLGEDRRDICSISPVCKTFLSITNKITSGLKLKDLSTFQFARLLQRFTELESLSITFPKAPSTSGFQGSGFRIKTLKKLIVTNPSCDDDLIALVDKFPCVEILKIIGLHGCSCPLDCGIALLASKLKGLLEITLVFCGGITDESLNLLSSNCPNLTKIFIIQCPQLTGLGIGYITRHCSKLTTLSISCLNSESSHPFNLENSFSCAKNLEDIRIYGIDVSDALLRSVANSCHRLKKVKLTRGETFSIDGLKKLLRARSSLEYFKPGVPWLTDKIIVDISLYLKSLTHINLEGSAELSSATFYLLTKRCVHFKEIVMDCTSVGINEEHNLESHQNLTMNSISIRSCKLMSDGELKRFGFVCPNLVTLYASDCPLLTYDGLSEIVRICPKIRGDPWVRRFRKPDGEQPR